MPVYKYKAINESGSSIEGVVDADSARSVVEELKRSGIYLSSIEEVKRGKRRGFRFLRAVSATELSISTRQFATMISAGLPLEASLQALSEQTEDAYLTEVMAGVKDSIGEGSSLAKALGEHPEVFSDLYINIVRAGEVSGTLGIVLERLADFLERQDALTSRIRSALVYPLFMMIVGSGVLVFMMTYVVPSITKIFEQSKKALPTITVVLIEVSSLFRDHLLLMLLCAAALIFSIYRFNKTPRGRKFFDRLILKIPTFGKITRMIIISRFTRTLGTLLQSGIPLLEALEVSESVVGNVVYRDALVNVRENLREGTSFSGPLRESGVFPPLVTRMVSVGEQTGELDDMLLRVADTYDLQVETTMSGLMSLLEPVMILVLGVVIGFIVFAILLPIFDLTSTIR
ncbi:MAG: type II secretion system inner membrane protein GspF [Candidatus Dadabacteria bacterium]|nr:type II secretion system inner membrane protein GspF [Candidatus Dadabacteria bacterium]